MRIPRSKKFLVLLAVLTFAGIAAAIAIPAVISNSVIADGTALHYRFQRTVAVDFDSGWHIHPGMAIVQVEEGSLQITQGNCTPKTVGPGETYIEVPYKPGRVVVRGRAVWTTSLFINGPDALLIPAPSPCP